MRARSSAENLKNVKDGNLREQLTVVVNFGNMMNSDLIDPQKDVAKLQGWITKAGLSKVEIDKRLAKATNAPKGADGKPKNWGDQPGGFVPSGGTKKRRSGPVGNDQADHEHGSDARGRRSFATNGVHRIPFADSCAQSR